MKKRLLTFLLVISMASITAIGCGKKDDGDKSDKSKERSESVKESDDDDEAISSDEIDVAVVDSDDEDTDVTVIESDDVDDDDDEVKDEDNNDSDAKYTPQDVADSILPDDVTMTIESALSEKPIVFKKKGNDMMISMDAQGAYVEVYYVNGETYSYTDYQGMSLWTKMNGQSGIDMTGTIGDINIDNFESVEYTDTITENGKQYDLVNAKMKNEDGDSAEAVYYINTSTGLCEKIETQDAAMGIIVITIEKGGKVTLPADAANAIEMN